MAGKEEDAPKAVLGATRIEPLGSYEERLVPRDR
jgi:hypothetical protein